MPNPQKRTKHRVNDDYWYPISKIMGIRWYMNKLENLLLSICAEHPDKQDLYRSVMFNEKKEDIYTRIWNALAKCEAEIIKIKKIHKPPRPTGRTAAGSGGCWCDDDCAPGFHCDQKTWLCEVGDDPPDPEKNL